MACTTHSEHAHEHSSTCGHKSIRHDDHVDYIHDGHLHHMHGDHADEHVLSHEAQCTPDHSCGSHDSSHTHGSECGHEAVPHADHIDYLVGEHLHRPCGEHCDDHGSVNVT